MAQHAAAPLAKESLLQTVRELVQGQTDVLDVTTPSVPGTELKIPHGLGRTPKGYMIIAKPYKDLNHGKGDTTWTATHLYLKFSLDNTALMIGVF